MMHLHNYKFGLKEKVEGFVCVACNCYFFNISGHPHTLIDSHITQRREGSFLKRCKTWSKYD